MQAGNGKYKAASTSRPPSRSWRKWRAVVFRQHLLEENPIDNGSGAGSGRQSEGAASLLGAAEQETPMKRILIAGALAVATAAPAFAADLPPPAGPPPRAPVAYIPAAPVFSWTGFYVGLNAGGAFGSSSWTTPSGPVSSFSTLGALFGGQIGGNYQIGQFVIGAEGDFDWQNLRGASASGFCAPPRWVAALSPATGSPRSVAAPASQPTALCSTSPAAALSLT